SYGDTFQVWDVATHRRVQEVHAGTGSVGYRGGDVLLRPDTQTLFTTGWDDPSIRLWRVSDGALVREIKTEPWTGPGMIHLLLRSDGKRLYANKGDNRNARVEIWDVDSGMKIRSSRKLADGAFVYAMALSEKHNRLL